MKKAKFSIKINAPREKAWNVLWNDATYRMWTGVFSEGSHAVTDWEEGSKVLFVSSDGGGMFSMIAKKVPNEFMSFKHLGVVKNGEEVPADEESNKWSGAMETYTLKETGGETELIVEMDVTEEFESYFNETFPKALEKVKELAEN
jgi:uncharacterized protein YndB with AHSA1/START domain